MTEFFKLYGLEGKGYLQSVRQAGLRQQSTTEHALLTGEYVMQRVVGVVHDSFLGVTKAGSFGLISISNFF